MRITMRWFAAAAALPFSVAHAAEGGLKLLSFTTLIGQVITFAILVWVMMKFVWPPLMNAVESRQKEIADGLAAAEQGQQDLANAGEERDFILKEARAKTGEIIADGEQRRIDLIEKAKQEAETERARIIELGKREVESERISMQREMQDKLGELAVFGATQILRREVDAKAHQDIVDSLKKAF